MDFGPSPDWEGTGTHSNDFPCRPQTMVNLPHYPQSVQRSLIQPQKVERSSPKLAKRQGDRRNKPRLPEVGRWLDGA